MRPGFLKTALLLIAIGCLAAGCNRAVHVKSNGRRAVIALMDSAESVMNDAPEHSLKLLDSIDSKDIRSGALNARYALLYTEAKYKCYKPVLNDSLIMIAVRYYSTGNHPEHQFRSYYSLGCIYYELGQLNNAAVALSEAERFADKVDDFRRGLLYSQLGVVYSESYDESRAEQCYKNASDCYSRSGKQTHWAYAVNCIAISKMNQHDFESADSLLCIIQEYAVDNDDRQLYINSIVNRLSCSLYRNEIDSCSSLVNHYLSTIGEPCDEWQILSLFADYYIKNKDYIQAESYLKKAWRCAKSFSDTINFYHLSSILAESKGHTDEALAFHKEYVSLQNQNIRKILLQPVLGAQKEYFQTIAELEALKNKHGRTVLTLSVIIFTLIIVIILIYHHYKRKRVEEQLYDSLSLVEELTATNRTHTDKIEYLRREVMKQFHERHDVSNLLYSMFSDTKSQEKITKQQLTVIVNSLIRDYTSPEYSKNLDVILNETYNGIMDRLSENELGLTEKELQLLRFSLAGLSLKSVSIIIKESSQNIYQIKSRLMKKIRSYSVELGTELDNLL